LTGIDLAPVSGIGDTLAASWSIRLAQADEQNISIKRHFFSLFDAYSVTFLPPKKASKH
jgi:hypothetical protein